jgi:hypothetical protein
VRGFVALLRREARDARWHLVAAAAIAAATPFVVRLALDGADAEVIAEIAARVVVPVLFALFVAATASDLVARDVATRRIDALAVLPVPVARVWAAKATLLGVSSIAFLAWVVGAQWTVLALLGPDGATRAWMPQLVDAVPSILGGAALGGASLFFSTLIERGMAAALGAVVVLVAALSAIHWADVPATPGGATSFALYALPALVAAAFVVASRTAFVRGPIHAGTKVRLVVTGLAAAAAVLVPAGAALAWTVQSATRLSDDAAAEFAAEASPDGKWLAVEERRGETSRVWLVGLRDDSCREVVAGAARLQPGGAWSLGSMLGVWRTSFSMLGGPCRTTALEIEPSRMGVADATWVRCPEETPAAHVPLWGEVRQVARATASRATFEVVRHGHAPRRLQARSVVIGHERDVAYVVSDSGVVTRLPLDGRAATELTRVGDGEIAPSCDGRRLLVVDAAGARVVDAMTGALVFDAGKRRAKWRAWNDPRHVVLWTQDAAGSVTDLVVRDLKEKRTAELGAPRDADCLPDVEALPDGRLVVVDGDVTLRDADGRVIRRLFPREGEKGN